MTTINGFLLGQLLGKGAFGDTYEATKAGQRIALKLIREEAVQQGFDLKRFEREVRALQKAVGPNVVRFIEAGIAKLGNETRYYVALELLDGSDLAHTFRESNQEFDEPSLKRFLIQIVDGLQTIHAQNIVHRDLKPANVFVTNSGDIKLLDFGLVKMLDYTTLTTVPGQAIGTPLYIAPEILRSERIDFRADFYSLGVLIYHLVTKGQYPFTAQTPLELYVQVVNNPPTPPTRYNRALSSDFENLILTLLSKQPYERAFTHNELREAIRLTPLNIPATRATQDSAERATYKKQCYFRLLQNEKGAIESFAQVGSTLDGIEYPANFLPRYQNSLNTFRGLGIQYHFDPVTYRLPYSSFAQTEGLVNLPYVPDPRNVLTPADLQTLQVQRTYVKKCIDWQMQWGCSRLVAPFHYWRDLDSEWIDIDIKLVEEALIYAKSIQNSPPLYAGLCINIEAFTVARNRLALLNRYSRARPDGFFFYVDSLDERTNNPLQLRALINLLTSFQQLGKPVFACRVGTLGLGLLAAGIDGMTTGIASLSSFSESNLLVNRATSYDMKAKYYVPQLMLALPVPMAEDILSARANTALRCDCPHCSGSFKNLSRIAKPHFLYQRVEEIKSLNTLPGSAERLEWFVSRVDTAYKGCEAIRKQEMVKLTPSYYSHFRTWLDVFGQPA